MIELLKNFPVIIQRILVATIFGLVQLAIISLYFFYCFVFLLFFLNTLMSFAEKILLLEIICRLELGEYNKTESFYQFFCRRRPNPKTAKYFFKKTHCQQKTIF